MNEKYITSQEQTDENGLYRDCSIFPISNTITFSLGKGISRYSYGE